MDFKMITASDEMWNKVKDCAKARKYMSYDCANKSGFDGVIEW